MIPVLEIFEDAIAAERRARRERQKARRITSIHAEDDGINVCFHTNEALIIQYEDYCKWYNDVSKDCSHFKPMNPEQINDWSLDHEDVLLYVRWELGYLGAFLPIEETAPFRNEDYVE